MKVGDRVWCLRPNRRHWRERIGQPRYRIERAEILSSLTCDRIRVRWDDFHQHQCELYDIIPDRDLADYCFRHHLEVPIDPRRPMKILYPDGSVGVQPPTEVNVAGIGWLDVRTKPHKPITVSDEEIARYMTGEVKLSAEDEAALERARVKLFKKLFP